MSPNPTALRCVVKEEDVERHRSLSCGEYDMCLGIASRRPWRSWSCGNCDLFKFAKLVRAAETEHEAALRPYA